MLALVVEDEPALSAFYRRVLEKIDYTVISASDGAIALNTLKNVEVVPDLIILDIHLPEIHGLQVLEFIANQESLHSTHVVIATAGSEYERYVGLVPSSEFLLKPIMPASILNLAKRIRPRHET